MPATAPALLGYGNLVDDALDQDDPDMDVPGQVRHELGNEVVDGRKGQADGIPFRAGGQIGLLSGNIEIADLVVDGKANQVGVVQHPIAVIALGPQHLVERVCDPALNGWHWACRW